jgi:DNA-binding response OmpR family regulator
MNNGCSILLVDSDEPFAVMLQESLEQSGEYRATVTTSGDEAVEALAAARFDLAIVDLGLTDPDGVAVVRILRQRQADLRLMLIPLVGEELPSELADLDVQGVLPKPFFLPELPGRIADALSRPMGEGADIAEAAEPGTVSSQTATVRERTSRRVSEKHMTRIVQAMDALAQEINAEAVILTHGGGLIAHTGRLSAEEAGGLAQTVGESWQTSARVAQILGREQLRFEQSVEGGEHMFYSLAVAEDIILSAALSAGVPLGMIRHQAKATADALRALIGKG